MCISGIVISKQLIRNKAENTAFGMRHVMNPDNSVSGIMERILSRQKFLPQDPITRISIHFSSICISLRRYMTVKNNLNITTIQIRLQKLLSFYILVSFELNLRKDLNCDTRGLWVCFY